MSEKRKIVFKHLSESDLSLIPDIIRTESRKKFVQNENVCISKNGYSIFKLCVDECRKSESIKIVKWETIGRLFVSYKLKFVIRVSIIKLHISASFHFSISNSSLKKIANTRKSLNLVKVSFIYYYYLPGLLPGCTWPLWINRQNSYRLKKNEIRILSLQI